MEPMQRYDFILAGGGIAGLSLAYHLIHSPLRDCSILIIDRDAKDRNDRTLCFWTEQQTLFDSIVYRSWDRLQFVGEDFQRLIELGSYRYRMIRGLDFYHFVMEALAACPNVDFVQGRIDLIEDSDEYATVLVGADSYAGTWVFDSLFSLARFAPNPARCHYLQQHFRGWEIETAEAVFDPGIATLFDFRTPQKGEMRFFYVLPFTGQRALVELVSGSPDHGDEALSDYVERTMGITSYRIVAKEGGVNPLTDCVFPRRTGRHVMTIGAQGGRVKPSSGYAFLRIQQDSAAIVQSMLTTGHPFDVPADSRWFRECDSLMLHVMQQHGGQMKSIFTAMFRNNPVRRIFRFLDETALLPEKLAMMVSLPLWPFLQALFRLKR
jgi:lycopene beta-cyclase